MEHTRKDLVKRVKADLTDDDKGLLLSIKRGSPQAQICVCKRVLGDFILKKSMFILKSSIIDSRGNPRMYDTLFGNKVAKRCLLYIVNYGEGYINGIARTFAVSPSQVQRQLEKLENDGILVSRFTGNTKIFRVNPRLAIKGELTALVESMLAYLPELESQKYFRQRRRPRRTGKTL